MPILYTVLAAASLDAITLQQREGGHRVFVDSSGRERIFHGTNAVVKVERLAPEPAVLSQL